jgi:hypothetical protein
MALTAWPFSSALGAVQVHVVAVEFTYITQFQMLQVFMGKEAGADLPVFSV